MIALALDIGGTKLAAGVVDDLTNLLVDEGSGSVVGGLVRIEVGERRHQPEAAPSPARLVLLAAHLGRCVEGGCLGVLVDWHEEAGA